jgi:hypothetical protein
MKVEFMNKYVVSMMLAGLVLSPVASIAHAQDAGSTQPTPAPTAAPAEKPLPPRPGAGLVQQRKDINMKARDTRKGIVEEGKTERKEIRESTTEKIRTLRESASSSPERRKEIMDARKEGREDIMDSRKEQREDMMKNREGRVEALRENNEAFKKLMETRKEELAKKFAPKKGEKKVKLKDENKEKIRIALENIFKHLTAQLTNLVAFDKRVAEKINARKTAGVDVTAAAAQYTVAQTALEKAKTDVAAAQALSIDQAVASSTSKTALRGLVKVAEDSLKAAGGEYRKIIPLLGTSTPMIPPVNGTTTKVQ